MKKTILLILAVLPIVLVIVIAFAGRILSIYQHIPVERVEFVDDNGDPFNDDMEFIVNMGQSKNCAYKIYPELSSNKKVTFTSNDESICTVPKTDMDRVPSTRPMMAARPRFLTFSLLRIFPSVLKS